MKNAEYSTNRPPEYIDGAKVIKWAWSGQFPFGFVENIAHTEAEQIFGLAICQYEKSKSINRFSCDAEWETIQDAPYDTINDSINYLPGQYKNQDIIWNDK
ncbi:hypothetical protein [Empedobacter sedimenti]|uniref:hypothetical protein n=1 Tax=Empedobacter sedimenti TaxID=3042610 RepID=UPI0024A72D6D|nr:hypothetical protein [Empedobacter sedimenti]